MSDIPREATGVDGLDRLLHGGFPRGSTTLMLGPTGTGKTTFSAQFICEGLHHEESTILVFSAQPIDSFLTMMRSAGWNMADHLDKMKFIDLYSWRIPEAKSDKSPYPIIAPQDLNELNKKVVELLDESKGTRTRVVVDSISDALLYTSPESVFKFMQLLVAHIRRNNATGLIILEQGLHPKEQQTTLEYITDNLIETKIDMEKRFIRIRKMTQTNHPLNWIEYTIEKGINMKVSPIFK